MSILDRLFKKETTMSAADKIKAVETRISAIQTAQADRDDRIKTLKAERHAVELDAVAGDAAMQKRLTVIDVEIARLSSLSADGARVLAELGDELLVLRQTLEAEQEAAVVAERQKQARADLRKLPGMFSRAKELQKELSALQAELREMGANGVDLESDDLDGQQAVAEAWLEWLAGIRDLDPVNAKLRSDYSALQKARAEREDFERGRNQRETERLSAAGWHPRGSSNVPFQAKEW